jgi:hypothetical protein
MSFMLCVSMLNVIMTCVSMLNVLYDVCFYAECRYTECRGAMFYVVRLIVVAPVDGASKFWQEKEEREDRNEE